MGLDMYLYARKHEYVYKYFKSKGTKLKPTYPKELVECFPQYPNEAGENDRRSICRNTYYEIGYWRKANQIHNYFVEKCADGVDECQEIRVRKEDLETLRDNCKYVLENKERAKEVLPTQDGFFFGSTSYDEYYFDDLKYTLEVVESALKLLENEEKNKTYNYEIIYQASW